MLLGVWRCCTKSPLSLLRLEVLLGVAVVAPLVDASFPLAAQPACQAPLAVAGELLGSIVCPIMPARRHVAARNAGISAASEQTALVKESLWRSHSKPRKCRRIAAQLWLLAGRSRCSCQEMTRLQCLRRHVPMRRASVPAKRLRRRMIISTVSMA